MKNTLLALLLGYATVASAASTQAHCSQHTIKSPQNLAKGSLTPNRGCGQYYTVKSGDTCAAVLSASKSKFSVDGLRHANPAIDAGCTNLMIGSAYCVDTSPCRAKGSRSVNSGCRRYARAAPKQTFRQLAKAANVKRHSLKMLNPHVGSIQAGSFYCVSGPSTRNVHFTQKAAGKVKATKAKASASKKHTHKHTAPAVKVGSKVVSPKQPNSAFAGIATWFTQNNNAGACGTVHSDSDYVVALYTSLYANGAHCGRKVKLTNKNTGISVTATVADECPSCGGAGDIDTSLAVFKVLSNNNLGAGVEDVSWQML